MPSYAKDVIRDLIDGKLPWQTTKPIMSDFKDEERFEIYLEILQERVPWKERILLPIGEHLYIVQKGQERIVKCDCGYEFAPYTENWKLEALVYVRDSEEELGEIYPEKMRGDPAWNVLREYFCPGCKTLLEVEAVPTGYPVIHDFVPDLEGFYEYWLGRPLPGSA